MTDPAASPSATINAALSGLHANARAERLRRLHREGGVSPEVLTLLTRPLAPEQADLMTENVVGEFTLPLSIATNFRVDGQDYLVPMAIEEPSVVAAASKAAKLARAGGGFFTAARDNIMTCQLLLMDVPDPQAAQQRIRQEKSHLQARLPVSRSVAAAGGGPRDLSVRFLPITEAGPMLVLHLTFDVGDAMGANIVNAAGEWLAPRIAELTGGHVVSSILSNLADERLASAQVLLPWYVLAADPETAGRHMQNICRADAWARADPYRAATHNKGILNGIGGLTMATGNDWRAIAAGVHAWAVQAGRYQGLTQWTRLDPGQALPAPWRDWADARDPRPALHGTISLPLTLGTAGGTPGSHPAARGALALLGNPSARRLARIAAAVGLAQNFAALRALTQEGIQQGHMHLHARQKAMAAGVPVDMVASVAAHMANTHTITEEAARRIWRQLQATKEDHGSTAT